jgi:hemerythrin-like domain-containing protein
MLERALDGPGHDEHDERTFQAVADYLAGPFASHLAVEEGVVFPTLIEHLPELALTLEPLPEEHALIREMSEGLGERLVRPGAPHRDEQLVVLGRDLADLVRLHIRKEERTVLDWSERVLPESVQFELGHRIAGAPAAARTRNPKRP